jgi:hypothetical protein
MLILNSLIRLIIQAERKPNFDMLNLFAAKESLSAELTGDLGFMKMALPVGCEYPRHSERSFDG